MRLKKLGAALFVVAAFGAVLASSAFAAATTTDVKWYTGTGAGTELTTSETIGAAQVGAATFATQITMPVVLNMTGINCVNCKIENSGGTAVGSGELEFTGVTVSQPAGCTVASTATTKPLSITADWMIGAVNYLKFTPTAGSTTAFVTVNVTGCGLGTTVFKGTVFVESANATGTPKVEQEVHSSESINSTAGGSLKVGTETVALTGSAKFKMTGAHAAQEIQTH